MLRRKGRVISLANVLKLLMVNVCLFGAYSVSADIDTGQTDGAQALPLSNEVTALTSAMPTATTSIASFFGTWTATSPAGTQAGRTNRDTIASLCDGVPLTTPLFNSTTLQSSQSAYTFSNPSSSEACFTIELTFDNPDSCGFNLQPNLYLGSFNPANPIENWIGTAGVSTGIPPNNITLMARLPPKATAVYVLNNTNSTAESTPCDFTVNVTAEIPVVDIGEPTNISGTGCPIDSSIISFNGYTSNSRMLSFSQHDVGKFGGTVANSGETWKSDCNFTLPITVPAGNYLKEVTLDWGGTSEGDTTKFRRKYLLDGESTGPWKNKKFNFGPATAFALQDKLTFITSEPPGDTLALNPGCEGVTHNLRVKTKLVAVYAHSYINIQSLMAAGEADGPAPDITVSLLPCEPVEF